jgi:hypothetical protein
MMMMMMMMMMMTITTTTPTPKAREPWKSLKCFNNSRDLWRRVKEQWFIIYIIIILIMMIIIMIIMIGDRHTCTYSRWWCNWPKVSFQAERGNTPACEACETRRLPANRWYSGSEKVRFFSTHSDKYSIGRAFRVHTREHKTVTFYNS